MQMMFGPGMVGEYGVDVGDIAQDIAQEVSVSQAVSSLDLRVMGFEVVGA